MTPRSVSCLCAPKRDAARFMGVQCLMRCELTGRQPVPPWHIIVKAMNLPGGGPSVPVDRVSPPLAQELEVRRGVGDVHPCVPCPL